MWVASSLLCIVLIFLYSANKAWPLVTADLKWFIDHGHGKKMYMDEVSTFFSLDYLGTQTTALQNGWPSVTSDGVKPNSPDAVADIPNEQVCIVRIILSPFDDH